MARQVVQVVQKCEESLETRNLGLQTRFFTIIFEIVKN